MCDDVARTSGYVSDVHCGRRGNRWYSGAVAPAAIDLNNAGFAIVALFAITWLCAIAYRKAAKVEKRWQKTPSGGVS